MLWPVSEGVDGEGAPGEVDPPQPVAQRQYFLIRVYLHSLPMGYRGRSEQLPLIPLPCFGQKLAHDFAVVPWPAAELSDHESIRWAAGAGGLGEQAEARARVGDIHVRGREAEQLAA